MTAHRDLHLELLHRLWRFGRAELGALAAMIIAATGLWVFADIAEDMLEGDGHDLDALVLAYFRPNANPHDALGPPWFEHAVAELTTLGGTTNLTHRHHDAEPPLPERERGRRGAQRRDGG